jgi:predicted N-acetyltransferase YhbS
MIIEKIKPNQVDDVSSLIQRNLREINSRDYSSDFIVYLLDCFSPENILENAKKQDIFVATEGGEVVGTGGLANFGSDDSPDYYGVAFFVTPEHQRKGIGRQLVLAVEAKAVTMGAEKITVRAAVGAREFYEELGYEYCDEEETQDEHGNYAMEKTLRGRQ